MATYYVIARMDGTRFVGPDHHKVDLYDALERAVTTFIPSAWQEHDALSVDDDEASAKSEVPVGLLVYPDPAQAGLGIADDMTLSLGIDGGFRLFQLQAVPAPEHYTPSSAIGAQAIVTREFLVVAEVPGWWAYGPHGRHVNGLISSVSNLERHQVDQIGIGLERADVIFEVDRREVLDAADLELLRHDRVGAARVAARIRPRRDLPRLGPRRRTVARRLADRRPGARDGGRGRAERGAAGAAAEEADAAHRRGDARRGAGRLRVGDRGRGRGRGRRRGLSGRAVIGVSPAAWSRSPGSSGGLISCTPAA